MTATTTRDATARHTVRRPAVLCILDGWGDRPEQDNNAIAQADTPVFDALRAKWPTAQLDASEGFVGLPSGQMGNSEVGHMNIGAGRVVMQDLPRIDAAIADGSITALSELKKFIADLKETGGTAHLIGLMSPGGVHSHQDHIAALANVLTEQGVPVAVHAILDGRDTPPKSAQEFLAKFHQDAPNVRIATVVGRFYAMDRDQRWDRVGLARDAIRDGKGVKAASDTEALGASYQDGKTDEFVLPTVIADYRGMNDGDGILMMNFRADRVREVLHAMIDPDFDSIPDDRPVRFAAVAGMVEYSADLGRMMDVLFPPEDLPATLGEVVASKSLKQLRIAETEKYAHVTFFFNGGREDVFDGEDRILVPSPKVATYDLQPEMSAVEVTDKLVAAIDSDTYDLIVVNYANTDMVGHTGDINAAIKAVETVDTCLGRLQESVLRAGGVMLITADHGNAEMMVDASTGQAHTAHTMNRVPLILVGAEEISAIKSGRLADLAPTLLALMSIEQPAEMTGVSLIDQPHPNQAAAE
ncbi:2,3-bisphosphoglycerate-independent phosphoglycerate mutase [Hwanghaeella sp.]|uniref:2,3-bisphosphoglycerate-independent phosphoglycerate mutase n=1 Tax=Hwanghaeella sp. TaxID=2605943 RepID=UPI003CCC183C